MKDMLSFEMLDNEYKSVLAGGSAIIVFETRHVDAQ